MLGPDFSSWNDSGWPPSLYSSSALIGHRVHGGNCPGFLVAAGDVNALRRCVIAQIIGAAGKIDRGDQVIGLAIEDVEFASAAGGKKLVGFGRKDLTLRIGHISDVVVEGSPTSVDHGDGIIA